MDIKCQIDEPEDRCIRKPTCKLRGWLVASPNPGSFEMSRLQFRIGQVVVPHVPTSRPDVEAAFPHQGCTGFLMRFDLTYYMQYVVNDNLVLSAVLPGRQPVQVDLTIDKGLIATCLAAAAGA